MIGEKREGVNHLSSCVSGVVVAFSFNEEDGFRSPLAGVLEVAEANVANEEGGIGLLSRGFG